MKVFLYVLLLAAVTIPLAYLVKRWVVRFEARLQENPERVRRVNAFMEKQDAEERAAVEPHLPELAAHPDLATFRAAASRWGWQQTTIEAQRNEYTMDSDDHTERANEGPLADVIARHPRDPVEVHWRFEYDQAPANPYHDANRYGPKPESGWRPKRAYLWLLGHSHGENAADPAELLQRFCHGVPAELWAEQAETLDDMTAYEDPDVKAKRAESHRRAGSAQPRPVD